jgi:ribonucleotide monophosphatase NagD (HAD superfamily)
MEVEVTQFGKPSRPTFEYAKKIVDAQAEKQGVEISKYFMIGDNPAGDIKGANQMGWESILVRTGVYKSGDALDEHSKPTHEVESMM